jgi:hypothetical protein
MSIDDREALNNELLCAYADLRMTMTSLEHERMCLAALSTGALCDTHSSIEANRIGPDSPYWSAAYGDVCRMVDRLMQMREENARLKALLLGANYAPV